MKTHFDVHSALQKERILKQAREERAYGFESFKFPSNVTEENRYLLSEKFEFGEFVKMPMGFGYTQVTIKK